MVSVANAVGAVNTAGLVALQLQLMALQEQFALLGEDDAGGAGQRTFVDPNAAAGGDGSFIKPFKTLDEAVTKINESAAAQAVATGTAAELAALMRPARVYLAAGTYSQSKPFTAPAVIIPAPGVVLPSIAWAPPAHNSTATGVPWTAGVVISGPEDGTDAVAIGDLSMVTVAPTAGSWAPSVVVSGSAAWRPGSVAGVSNVGNITTTGPTNVAILAEFVNTLDVTADAAQLTARHAELQSIAITAGGAVLENTFVPGTADASLPIIARDSTLTGGGTADFELWTSTLAGAFVGDMEFHACEVTAGMTVTGDVPYIDTATWGQMADLAIAPTGTVNLYGTTGGVIAAAGSPQVISFGVTFPATPRGVTVTPQAATVDATTFVGVTAKSATTVTVAYGGAGAGAPTFFHWVATL